MQRFHRLVRELRVPTLLETTTNFQILGQIQAQIIVDGSVHDPFIACRLLASPSLVDFNYTHLIFTQISSPSLFIWNTMIKKLVVFTPDSTCSRPLLLYRQMLCSGLNPNGHTFMYCIKALSAGKELKEGEELHSHVMKFGYWYSEYVAGALIGLYVACGFLRKARQVFDELFQPGLVLWTAMIRAYVLKDCSQEALLMFRNMRQVDIMPDSVALATVVSACSELMSLDMAKSMHGFINKSGIGLDDFVSSAVVGMYGDSGSLDFAYQYFLEVSTTAAAKNVVVWNTMIHQCLKNENLKLAQWLFDKMVNNKDVVSWNTMISGFSRVGKSREAIELFHRMELCNVKPNELTLLTTLSACASLGAAQTAIRFHAYIEKKRLNSDGFLDPGLIDMYSKCGHMDKAIRLFDKVGRRDVFSWTTIICGLAIHGHGKEAVRRFCQMQEARVEPDDVVFVGLLNACAHAGLLVQGWEYFGLMQKVYNLTPKIEHYGCMVDLLGRMGCLNQACHLITRMPMEPNQVIWATLLSACRVHNNVGLAEIVAKKMIELDHDASDPWIRVMLSNIYAESCKWEGTMKLRKEIKEKGWKKQAGCSSIEVNGVVYEFVIADISHPQHIQIQTMLTHIQTILQVAVK